MRRTILSFRDRSDGGPIAYLEPPLVLTMARVAPADDGHPLLACPQQWQRLSERTT